MKTLTPLILFLILCLGCSDVPQATAPPRPAGEVILSCVEASGAKLEAALAGGDLATAVREIVHTLDDYEDSPEMAHFEEFHRQMEQLESLTAKEPTSDELAAKITEIKTLADKLVAEKKD